MQQRHQQRDAREDEVEEFDAVDFGHEVLEENVGIQEHLRAVEDDVEDEVVNVPQSLVVRRGEPVPSRGEEALCPHHEQKHVRRDEDKVREVEEEHDSARIKFKVAVFVVRELRAAGAAPERHVALLPPRRADAAGVEERKADEAHEPHGARGAHAHHKEQLGVEASAADEAAQLQERVDRHAQVDQREEEHRRAQVLLDEDLQEVAIHRAGPRRGAIRAALPEEWCFQRSPPSSVSGRVLRAERRPGTRPSTA
mmetsp:Transcript_7217/g.23520  ORF Transcript_7217/g.23520 Transcript_7217/m.23520 type:complete len:254 (-) Transcript_7217:8-769(-)